MRLSVITDEVSQDPAEAIDFLLGHGVDHVALRAAWGVNLALLPEQRLVELGQLLRSRGVTVSAIMSPLFKCPRSEEVSDLYDPHVIGVPPLLATHLDLARRLPELAERFVAPIVRIFAFLESPHGSGTLPVEAWDVIAAATADWPVGLAAVENEHVCSIRTLDELQGLTKATGVRVVIDPANHCRVSSAPVDVALTSRLIDAAVDVHVKDLRGDTYVPLGQGDLPWPAMFARLHTANYDGFITLECHLRGDLAGVSASIINAQWLIRESSAPTNLLDTQQSRA